MIEQIDLQKHGPPSELAETMRELILISNEVMSWTLRSLRLGRFDADDSTLILDFAECAATSSVLEKHVDWEIRRVRNQASFFRHVQCQRRVHNGVPVQTHVEFRSDRFAAYESEEQQINPGRWAKRLPEFLGDDLRTEGFETEEPIAEDWGWMLPAANDHFQLWIGCGNYEEYPDGFLCFIEPHTPFVRKFLRNIDTQERVGSLWQAMGKLLTEAASIRDKRWWTHDEFDHER